MLESLNQFIVRCSFSAWKVLLLFLGFFGSLQALMFIGEKIAVQTGGYPPFDLQNFLTPEELLAQLPQYSDDAISLYLAFTTSDYLFPLFAGLFLATLWAFVLRHTKPRLYDTGVQKNRFVLLLIPTLLDWLENILLLTAIMMWPETPGMVAEAAVIAKQAKLVTTLIAQVSTGLLLVYGLIFWITSKLQQRS